LTTGQLQSILNRKLREFREQQALLFATSKNARRLAQAELSELSAVVEIYRALGGGWQT
jgi:uncharacterized protein (DUF4415 family)